MRSSKSANMEGGVRRCATIASKWMCGIWSFVGKPNPSQSSGETRWWFLITCFGLPRSKISLTTGLSVRPSERFESSMKASWMLREEAWISMVVPNQNWSLQMRTPRRLPVVCGKDNFVPGVDDKVLIISHYIGYTEDVGQNVLKWGVKHLKRTVR